jgi:hypothetical protein
MKNAYFLALRCPKLLSFTITKCTSNLKMDVEILNAVLGVIVKILEVIFQLVARDLLAEERNGLKVVFSSTRFFGHVDTVELYR